MENKHKKRKAFIIAIIAIIVLFLTIFLVYKYRDSFGVKTSSNITKIFSPLISSINQKGFLGQKNIPPTVMKSVAGDDVLGVANEDILYQETGEITTKTEPVGNILLVIGGENIKNGDSVSLLKASNPFWKSFVGLFSKKKVVQDNSCTNNTDNFPLCTTKNGACINDATNPPLCTSDGSSCKNGTDNFPLCTTIGGVCINDATNPPLCNDDGTGGGTGGTGTGGSGGTGIGGTGGTGDFQYLPQCADTKDNDGDGLIDEKDPQCHVGGIITGEYVPGHYSESSFPVSYLPVCMDKKDNDKDGLIDEFDPECHVGGTLDGEYVPGHYSESASPFQYLPACMDTKDNDSDGLIDELDPNCHLGGVLTGDYVPSHYSESSSPIGPWNEGIDLTASGITPTSAKSNTPIKLSSTITNNGNKSTEKSFITLFTITTNTASAIANTGDINLTATTPTLSAETQSVANVSHTFTSAGVYYVRACADKKAVGDAGTITEYNENNNCGEWTTLTIDSSLPQEGDLPDCSDTIDNDGDGLIDELDPECHVGGVLTGQYLPEYTSEANAPKECNDTLDNDEDGYIDEKDPECHVGGVLTGQYLPEYTSEANAPVQCNDTVDNDADKLIDEKDPGCHKGGVIDGDYVSTWDNEKDPPEADNVCLQLPPLIFTAEEEAKLQVLLRKFYLIAPTLKTEDDIISIYSEMDQYKNLIVQAEDLTNKCYAQVDNNNNWKITIDDHTSYTNTNLIRRGNPWFRPLDQVGGVFPYGGTSTSISDTKGYLDYDAMEWNGNIGQGPAGTGGACPLISGYYSGTTTTGIDCATYTPQGQCWGTVYTKLFGDDATVVTKKFDSKGNVIGYPEQDLLKAGCQWHEGVFLEYTEKILSIW